MPNQEEAIIDPSARPFEVFDAIYTPKFLGGVIEEREYPADGDNKPEDK